MDGIVERVDRYLISCSPAVVCSVIQVLSARLPGAQCLEASAESGDCLDLAGLGQDKSAVHAASRSKYTGIEVSVASVE